MYSRSEVVERQGAAVTCSPIPNDVRGGFTPATTADGDRLDDGGCGSRGMWGLDTRMAVGTLFATESMEGGSLGLVVVRERVTACGLGVVADSEIYWQVFIFVDRRLCEWKTGSYRIHLLYRYQ